MYFHLILTDNCNLCCSYCRAKAFEDLGNGDDETEPVEIDPVLPTELDIDLPQLYAFLKKDPAVTLTFYGGEPLLKADLIETITSSAPVQRFMLQTNALLLDRLAPGTVNRFSTILVSIDGREALTDANRGTGVYRKVIRNVKRIRANGFTGELIARMTVTERTDIVDAVSYLADNPDYSFSSIHWQLDANFAGDFRHRNFTAWVQDSYNPGIRALVTTWVDRMADKGEVLRWYPFLDPMEDLLLNRPSRLRCGSGYANYSIQTDGHIAPCPVMIGMMHYYVGHIADADPTRLPVISVNGECAQCSIQTFCGGRCLYSNITKPWRKEERGVVCDTVKNLHSALVDALPRVQSLINHGTVTLEWKEKDLAVRETSVPEK
ncbi:MAG: TIGR04084 family radical SAM/SPASM domain-containing protein [Methanoregula sp.]|nr:TIGR04084 family radical SAM/SPASM domain-containing protein [Methanoregula sp.]